MMGRGERCHLNDLGKQYMSKNTLAGVEIDLIAFLFYFSHFIGNPKVLVVSLLCFGILFLMD